MATRDNDDTKLINEELHDLCDHQSIMVKRQTLK